MIENDNFITIQGFMVNDLKLKGNELIIFALIFGFSQDAESTFHGSLRYIREWTNLSTPAIIAILKSLQSKNLIEKIEKTVNGTLLCDYRAVKKVNTQLSFLSTTKETLLHNKEYIYTNHKYIKDNDDNNSFNYGVKKVNNEKEAKMGETIEELNRNYDLIDQPFNEFWSIYPRRVDKARAYRAWKKQKLDADEIAVLLDRLKKQVELGILKYKDAYTPYPASWINGRRWEDELIEKDDKKKSAPKASEYLTYEDDIIT